MLDELTDHLKELYPVTLHIIENDHGVTVQTLIVQNTRRGEGIGTAVMREIISHALRQNKPVFLTASTDYGGKIGRLKKFYLKRLGFVPNKGRHKDFASREALLWKPAFNRRK